MKSFRFITIALFLLMPRLVFGVESSNGVYDYFGPKPAELLRAVESYHLQQGITKMNDGRLQYAFQDFQFMLNRFPNHPKALALMVEVTNKMGKPGLAERFFAKAIELYPNTGYTYVVYGMHLQKTGKVPAAIENYKKAIELSHNAPEAHYNLGLAYVAEKRYDLANIEANTAYDLGHPLPGLRKKLEQAGAWKLLPKPVAEEEKAEEKAVKKVEQQPAVEPVPTTSESPPTLTQPLK